MPSASDPHSTPPTHSPAHTFTPGPLPNTSTTQSASPTASLQQLQQAANAGSRLNVIGVLQLAARGTAALFGSALAIIGGGANALMVGIAYLAVSPGALAGGLAGGIIGLGIGIAKGDIKQNMLDKMKEGAKAGMVVAAIPVAIALFIPICCASSFASAGENLLQKASGRDSAADDAWPLQKFAATFNAQGVLKLFTDKELHET